MATVSNSYTFSTTTAEVITDVMDLLGVTSTGDTVSSADTVKLTRVLNTIIKNLAIQGYLIWTYAAANTPLILGTSSYLIGPQNGVGGFSTLPKPERIAQAWIQDANNNRTPIQIIARKDFNTLTPRSSPGIPNQLYYDNQVSAGVLYNLAGTVNIWPVTNVSGYSLYLSYQRPIMDVINATDTFDIPQEWFLPLKWLLAKEVGLSYTVNLQKWQMIKAEAEGALKAVADFAVEDGDITFVPDPQMRQR